MEDAPVRYFTLIDQHPTVAIICSMVHAALKSQTAILNCKYDSFSHVWKCICNRGLPNCKQEVLRHQVPLLPGVQRDFENPLVVSTVRCDCMTSGVCPACMSCKGRTCYVGPVYGGSVQGIEYLFWRMHYIECDID